VAPGPSFSTPTEITNVGTTPLYFNSGSHTFIGTPATAGGPAFVNLNGHNAIVTGGLFVNNGNVFDLAATGATIVADTGALVKGAGNYQNPVITQNGGQFQAGNSPGSTFVGPLVLGWGGVSNYIFAIDDATGTAGPSPDAAGHVDGWGLINAENLSWTADSTHPFIVALQTLVNPTTVGTDVPGTMDHFDQTQSYSWAAVHWTGTYTGPTDVAALNAATVFDTSGFANTFSGTFGWSLDIASGTLSLTYTPAP
jgi:hypothetical protein